MERESIQDSLNRYIVTDASGRQSLFVPEGTYRGWVPRALYAKELLTVQLPFLRLLSFPVGGTPLGNLPNILTDFGVEGNNLSKLPSCFEECKHLTRLNLSYNNFTEVPFCVYKLTKLEDLQFEQNDLTYVDKEIGRLKNLRTLNLGGNLLSELPDELKKCRKMRSLTVSGKFYPRGTIMRFPECICSLTDLIELDLSWQQVGNIPDSIGNLKRLEVLCLKWNQLRNVSKELKRCCKLKVIDFSGALRLLSVIPEALLYLEDLHALNLSDNFFVDVPQSVCGLVKLRTLAIQRNSLLRISPQLFQLRYLEHLELSENYLLEIPSEIRSLKRLVYLGLDNNKLKSLPMEICRLENIEHLNISHNELNRLPESIYELHLLKYLNVSYNCLKEIPLLMDRLHILAERDSFHCLNNNLCTPYKEMSEQGTRALFEFLKGIRLKEAFHRRKMILIGAAKAGKTSLKQALVLNKSKLTAEEDRTWVMERLLWEPESRLRVQILDLGGHHIYQAAHHMFLSSDALHVLVFDLTKYSTDVHQELIGHWLDAIMDRAAGATIIIVGTHCDLCTKEDIKDKKDDILRLIKRDDENKCSRIEREIAIINAELDRPEMQEASTGIPEISVGRLQQKLYRLQKMLNSRSKVPQDIFVVSCAENLQGILDFRDALLKELTSSHGTKIPGNWCDFLEKIQQIDSSVLTFREAMHVFTQIMSDSHQSMMGLGGSPERSLEMVLKYFHSTGELVWYHDNELLKDTVFHHPETLIKMLRVVFRHDFKDVVVFNSTIGNELDFGETQFNNMKDQFLNRGLLTKELLRYLFIHFELSENNLEDLLKLMVELMLKFNLCFKVNNPQTLALLGSRCVVQFPWFFPINPTPEISLWNPLPPNKFELCVEINFSDHCPPNLFEKLSVMLHGFLSDTDCSNWRDGVLAQINETQLLLLRRVNEEGTQITVTSRSSWDLQEMWRLIKNVYSVVQVLFRDWPLLKCEIFLVCMHCVLKGKEEPYRYHSDVLDCHLPTGIYTMKCCRKSPNEPIPSCFVFPLEESCYQENHIEYMQKATDFMHQATQGSMDSVDGQQTSQLMSYGGLASVAANLGFNWTMVLLKLGITQARIEQLQMDFQGSSYNCIFNGLKDWYDNNQGSGDEQLLETLLSILSSDEIGRVDLVDKLKQDYSL